MLSYLKFLLKSTNEHGVHSPFVFNYLTKCLYTKPRLSKNKVEDILLKSISYFGCKNLKIEDESLKRKIVENHITELTFDTSPLDLVVLKDFKCEAILSMIASGKVHNDTFFLVQHLRKNHLEWQKTILHPKITVSIDGFSLGIFFIRKEQVKEHFTIRI